MAYLRRHRPRRGGGESGSSASPSDLKRLPFPMNSEGVFVDDGEFATDCTKIYRRIENPGGFSWKLTSQDVKDKYFDEFKKYYFWPEEMTALVHKRWESKARGKFSSHINEIKQIYDKSGDKPKHVNLVMWNELKEYWKQPDVLLRSNKARSNRLTPVDGPGSGISKHKGGSRSVSRRVNLMCKEKGLPWDSFSYETFRALHVKEDGTPLTEKDEKIEARVQQIAAEEGEGADKNTIYKGRFYGSGDNSQSLLTDATSARETSSQLASQHLVQSRIVSLEEQLQEEREKREQLETQFAATQKMVDELMSSHLNRSSNGSDTMST